MRYTEFELDLIDALVKTGIASADGSIRDTQAHEVASVALRVVATRMDSLGLPDADHDS